MVIEIIEKCIPTESPSGVTTSNCENDSSARKTPHTESDLSKADPFVIVSSSGNGRMHRNEVTQDCRLALPLGQFTFFRHTRIRFDLAFLGQIYVHLIQKTLKESTVRPFSSLHHGMRLRGWAFTPRCWMNHRRYDFSISLECILHQIAVVVTRLYRDVGHFDRLNRDKYGI